MLCYVSMNIVLKQKHNQGATINLSSQYKLAEITTDYFQQEMNRHELVYFCHAFLNSDTFFVTRCKIFATFCLIDILSNIKISDMYAAVHSKYKNNF